MFFLHRLTSLITMMYNEQEETTLAQFLKPDERAKMAARAALALNGGDFLSASANGPVLNSQVGQQQPTVSSSM